MLMGSRRSGKTSMWLGSFGNEPHETLFVPSTAQPATLSRKQRPGPFSILDAPGDRDLSELRWRDAQMTPRDLFGRCVASVREAGTPRRTPTRNARDSQRVAAAAKAANARVQLEVFVHKVDGDTSRGRAGAGIVGGRWKRARAGLAAACMPADQMKPSTPSRPRPTPTTAWRVGAAFSLFYI